MTSGDQPREPGARQEGDRPLSEAVLGAWRADPDPARAVTLCSAVRPADVAARRDLVMALGREVRAHCADNLPALLAVARMYIVAEALGDAQSTLVTCANVAPDEPRTFALLGQVMLRLGDARRAVLAFEQATSRGLTGPATQALFERAQYYADIQDAQGEDAVAEAVRAELAPAGMTAPPPPVRSSPPRSDPPRSDPPTVPTGSGSSPPGEAHKKPAFARTLIGFGTGSEPPQSPDDIEKVLSAFVGEQTRRALGPKDSPVQTSEPPPRPYSNRPAQAKDDPPTTRYSVIKPDARAGTKRRSDRPYEAPAGRSSPPPGPHRDHHAESWQQPPETRPSGGPPPERPRTPPRAPVVPDSGRTGPPGPFERTSSPPAGGLSAVSDAAKRDSGEHNRRRTRILRYVIPPAVVVVAVIGIEAGRYLQRAESSRAASMLIDEADKAMHTGSPRSLVDAEASLKRAREADPASLEVALATVQARLLRTLDADESAASLTEAVEQARGLSIPDRELAAAQIILALVAKDTPRADELVRVHDDDRGRGLTAVAFYELAAGVALERRGDTHAIERLQAAVRADPSLFPAEVRLIRAQLLYGDPSEGRRRARALPQSRAEGSALLALSAFVTDPASAPVPTIAGSDDELPRSLRSIARALVLRSTAEPTGRGAAFSATIEAADVPAAAMFCGQLALGAGESEAAEFGARRAVDLSPSFAPALALLARTALARGDLDRMKEMAAKLGGREGSELRAIAAYEDVDVGQMEEIAKAMSPPPADGDASRIAIDRLRGVVLTSDRLKSLTKADPVWGELVRVDVALDNGDLDTARDISDGWSLGSQHPLRSLRLARRLRYEGRLEDARHVLEAAAPTRSALIERALLAGELRTDRTVALSALDVSSLPEKNWLIGYLRARQGVLDKAQKLVAPLEMPGDGAPRSTRIAACLAMSELTGERRGKLETQKLLDSWPKNPDIIRAAVGFEIMPKSALLKRRGR